MTAIAERNASTRPATAGSGEHWGFPESFAATWLELRKEKCAPPVITWMPVGYHPFIRPLGAAATIEMHVHSPIAAIANRHLQQMRASAAAGTGPAPFLDFNHSGVMVGEPLEFFWDGARGVRLFVKWLPAAEQLILRGEANGFSPQWARSGTDFLGILPNAGALLSRSNESAFGRRMLPIVAISKLESLQIQAAAFLRRVDARVRASRNADESKPAILEAFEAIKEERPELHASYQLLQAVQGEFATDAALA
jgi:hypothetical protein